MTGKNENVNYKPMFLLSAMFMGIIGSGFMSKEDLPVQNVPSIMQQKEELKLFVDAPVAVDAGDITSINKITNTVMGGKIPAMITPVLKSSEGLTSVYQLGDYEVTLENLDLKKSSQQEVLVSVRKVTTGAAAKEDNLVLTTVNDEDNNAELDSELVSTYKVNVEVIDSVKPEITVSEEEVTITEGDDFEVEDYFVSAIDNVDGDLDHETDTDVDTEEPGIYYITYTARDNAGNETSTTITVVVEEKEEEPEEEVVEVKKSSNATVSSSYRNSGSSVASSVNGSGVAGAAMAQLGVRQDCTALVSNALAAQGIYFRGAPAAYMSLGTIISASEAQPGDILYYANGGTGLAHVAVYAGNGQAVHGGWQGSNTVLTSAYVGSGPVFIRVGR